MYFDARAAKLLKPGEHLLVDGCGGLRLVATATRRTWVYRYKSPADGRMKQVALGQWPAVPVTAAAAAWQDLRDQRGAGTDPGAVRRAERQAAQGGPVLASVYAVADLVTDYLDGHIDHSRKAAGATAARRALERLLTEDPGFAAKPAGSVTRADAFKVLDSRKATPTSTQKLRSMLGAAWDLALDAGRIDGETPNWWREVLRGKLKSKGKLLGGENVGRQRRVLRPAEVADLLAWLPNMHALASDVTQMYLWTCARGSEILSLRPEHVTEEPDGWWWTVPAALTKNARFDQAVDLRVPLIGRALQIVQRRIEAVGASGWLFADDQDVAYTQHRYSTYIYDLQPYSVKVERRQGEGLVLPVSGWTPHALRKTGRTLLASLGCPQEIAEAILGHMPGGIVGTYNAYSYDAERREWLTRLAERLETLAPSQRGRSRSPSAATGPIQGDRAPRPPAPRPARQTARR